VRETFVLIHGSWHGGWAWEGVIRRLSEQGYSAHAPMLAGHGPGTMRLGITHQDCVASVVTCIERRRLKDVILVGHSFGGSVVQKVAEILPNRTARMVFLDALVLEDNECVLDILPAEFATLPKSFIYCRQDKALPPGYFHPRMSSRLGRFKLLEIDGSHEVMLTRSRELADKLIEASSD
jgi:hypothetical protein